jgi:putative transposase
MHLVTRIRIYPNPGQAKQLDFQFGCARWVWNDALAMKQKTYLETGKNLGYQGS